MLRSVLLAFGPGLLLLFCGHLCPGLASGTAAASTTAAPRPEACSHFSGSSCDQCLKNVTCLWCYTNSTCVDYPARNILPSSTLCPLSDARWGACWLNFEALIIGLAVIAGLMLLCIAVCCCYCYHCCKKRSRRRLSAEAERLASEREERRVQALRRKSERKVKHDDIRKKYGLLQDSDNPYSRFENE